MAEAGFYHVGRPGEPDLARCYWCRRELDGWESTDDPWSEHERRPCPFIALGKKASQLTKEDFIKLEVERQSHLQVSFIRDFGNFWMHFRNEMMSLMWLRSEFSFLISIL